VNKKALRPDPNREPTHPGALLREDVLARDRRPGDGGGQEARRHAPAPASRPGREGPGNARHGASPRQVLGNGPDLWLRMQQAYDLWHAERALRKVVAKIPTAKARAA